MIAKVVQLPHASPYEPWLSKTQLAGILGYSRRWIETQVAAGAPSIKLPNGQRRFKLAEFTAWLERKGDDGL